MGRGCCTYSAEMECVLDFCVMIMFKWILEKQDVVVETGLSGSG
jgi:hypothetical protein